MNNLFQNILRVSFIIIFFSVLGCKTTMDKAEESSSEEVKATNIVQLTDAQMANADLTIDVPLKMLTGHVITLNGKMEVTPENRITASAPMSGFVRQLKILPGMTVQKGQTMMVLEDKEYIQLQQDYLSAKNAWAYAKADFERQSELSKNQAASEKVLQQAEEKMKQQQILVKSLAEKLRLIHINPASLSPDNLTSQITINAPVTGMITEVAVNSGKYVQAGEEMVKMVASGSSKLLLKAFEKDIPYLRKGQKISAYTNVHPDKKMNGTIEYIVHEVSQEGFTRIICALDNKNADILPGMYVNADIEADRFEGWTVPDEAIVHFEGKEYVFLEKENQTYMLTEIKTGQKENGRVQVLNAETILDRKIVVKGAYTLLMKMKNVAE